MGRIYVFLLLVLCSAALHAQKAETYILQRGFVGVHLETGVLSNPDSGYARIFKSQPALVNGFGISFGRNLCIDIGYSSYTIYGPYFKRYDAKGAFIADSNYTLTNGRLHLTLIKYIDINEQLAIRLKAGMYRNYGTLTFRSNTTSEVDHYENQAFLLGAGVENPVLGALCLYLDANYLYSVDGSQYIYNTGGLQLSAGLTVTFL